MLTLVGRLQMSSSSPKCALTVLFKVSNAFSNSTFLLQQSSVAEGASKQSPRSTAWNWCKVGATASALCNCRSRLSGICQVSPCAVLGRGEGRGEGGVSLLAWVRCLLQGCSGSGPGLHEGRQDGGQDAAAQPRLHEVGLHIGLGAQHGGGLLGG